MENELRKKQLSPEAIQALSAAYDQHGGTLRAIADENGGKVFMKEKQIYPPLKSLSPSESTNP